MFYFCGLGWGIWASPHVFSKALDRFSILPQIVYFTALKYSPKRVTVWHSFNPHWSKIVFPYNVRKVCLTAINKFEKSKIHIKPIQVWNSLPSNIRSLKTISSFTKKTSKRICSQFSFDLSLFSLYCVVKRHDLDGMTLYKSYYC